MPINHPIILRGMLLAVLLLALVVTSFIKLAQLRAEPKQTEVVQPPVTHCTSGASVKK